VGDYSLKGEKRPLLDLYTIPEDERIRMIGERARITVTDIMLEKDEITKGKIARYIRKVTERFPDVKHVGVSSVVEIPGVAIVRFAPKAHEPRSEM